MKHILTLIGLAIALALGFATYDLMTTLPQPVYHESKDPVFLSEWQLLSHDGDRLYPNKAVAPYDLKVMLFSDYAQKLRTVWVPPNATPGALLDDGSFDMPVGTVISKTFYYEQDEAGRMLNTPAVHHGWDARLFDMATIRLIETRLLVKRAKGWVPLSYVWNDDQTDARLTKIGKIIPLTLMSGESETTFNYMVPDINQCGGCHAPNNTTRKIEPLGFRKVHIDKPFQYTKDYAYNQISTLARGGILDMDLAVDIQGYELRDDYTYSLSATDARLYLDINCAHCHNAVGPADTSGLDLSFDAPLDARFGICKLPIAAGAGTGGRSHDIVPGHPDQSILVYRMETRKPGAMMPELGRALAHQEGIDLVRDWVSNLDGSCQPSGADTAP